MQFYQNEFGSQHNHKNYDCKDLAQQLVQLLDLHFACFLQVLVDQCCLNLIEDDHDDEDDHGDKDGHDDEDDHPDEDGHHDKDDHDDEDNCQMIGVLPPCSGDEDLG